MHILGLGIDPAAPDLSRMLHTLQTARETRNPRILDKLTAMGMPLTMADVQAAADRLATPEAGGDVQATAADPHRILGRVHIALALLAKGHVRNLDEAFEKFIGRGRPAYVDKERLSPPQAIAGIHAAGGLAILAHPPQLGCQNDLALVRVLRDLIHDGLDGIEAFHSDNDPRQTRLYLDFARRFNLGVTGGSDFHGTGKPQVHLGRPAVPLEALGDRLMQRLKLGN